MKLLAHGRAQQAEGSVIGGSWAGIWLLAGRDCREPRQLARQGVATPSSWRGWTGWGFKTTGCPPPQMRAGRPPAGLAHRVTGALQAGYEAQPVHFGQGYACLPPTSSGLLQPRSPQRLDHWDVMYPNPAQITRPPPDTPNHFHIR